MNFDCDCFYTSDRDALLSALSVTPEYLRNEATQSGRVIDYRDWQVPLGRRFRALKLWFVIRHYGVEGLQAHIREHACTRDLQFFRGSKPPGKPDAATDYIYEQGCADCRDARNELGWCAGDPYDYRPYPDPEDYAPGDREQALDHFRDPATVLRSADGLVLAQVCWFWSEPGLVLKTWMSDESLVETWRRWPEVPPWPARRAAAWRYATVTTFMRGSRPGSP